MSLIQLHVDIAKSYDVLQQPELQTLTTSTEFNQNVFVDEFEVELSDGTKVLSMMILDDASSFRVTIPTANFSSISGSESKRCLYQGWFLWAGAPKILYYDMAKGHLASEFTDQGDELSMVLRPIPAESPHLKGRVEKAIDFFKDMFVKLNAQFQFNQRNDPQEGVPPSLSLATITSGGTVSRHTNMSLESHHGSQRLLLK